MLAFLQDGYSKHILRTLLTRNVGEYLGDFAVREKSKKAGLAELL
jgi:hypothetical protein